MYVVFKIQLRIITTSISQKLFKLFVSNVLGHVVDCYIMQETDSEKYMDLLVEENCCMSTKKVM